MRANDGQVAVALERLVDPLYHRGGSPEGSWVWVPEWTGTLAEWFRESGTDAWERAEVRRDMADGRMPTGGGQLTAAWRLRLATDAEVQALGLTGQVVS